MYDIMKKIVDFCIWLCDGKLMNGLIMCVIAGSAVCIVRKKILQRKR